MHAFTRPLATLLKLRPFLLTLLCGLLLTAGLAMWINSLIQRDAHALLGQITSVAALQIETRQNEQAEVLRGLQGTFIANPGLGRETFQSILENQNILSRLAGFVAIGFARQLEREQLKPFITAIRNTHRSDRDHYQDYTVHPDTNLARAQPVEYLYPVNISTAAYLGLDLLSLTDNRSALAISRDEGRGITSPPFKLGPKADSPQGFMVHYPVYSPGPKSPTAADRQTRYLGSLTAIYRADQMLASMDANLQNQVAQTRLYDTGGALDRATRRPETLLYETRHPQIDHGTPLCSNQLINLPGRQWRLELCATTWQIVPQHQDSLWLFWLAGICLTLLLGTLLQAKMNAAELARKRALDIRANMHRRESHLQKLAILAEQTDDIIVLRDAQGRIEYANPAAQNRLGRTEKPLKQSTEPLLLSAELGELSEPLHAASSHRDIEGGISHYEASVIPLHDMQGRPLGSALLAHDITRDREQNEALRRSNERLSGLLELSNDWVWEQDATGHFTHVSGGLFKNRDINPAHMVGLTHRELAQAGLSEAEWASHRKTIEAHQPYQDFIFTLRGGSEPLVISLSGQPVLDEAGYFVGYRGIGRDITAWHQHRLIVQAENQRLIATLESLSDGVITTDLSGRIDYMNPVAIALTGHELAEALNHPVELIFQVVDPVTRLPLPSQLRQVLAGSYAPQRHRTAVLLNRFGLNFTIQEAVARIRDEQGHIRGSVVVFRDLSNWLDQANPPE